jgi:dihydroxyacetone kinase-like predicted kinase
MLRAINGQPLDTALTSVLPLSAMSLEDTMETIEPGQDYEVVVDFRPFAPLNLEQFYGNLERMGTSIQVGEGDGIYRMHIHVPAEKLYEPIEYTKALGTVTKAAIENLIAQMTDLEGKAREESLKFTEVEAGQIAVIAVSPGLGISRVFASLGVAAIVKGGQTMNPSTQDILESFEPLPADRVIILPNNKNIILAARAAAELTAKKVAIVPSRTIPEGLAAMLRLSPEGDFDRVVAEMTGAIDEVQTGEITTAVRAADLEGVSTDEGQFIALLNRRLVCSSDSLESAVLGLLQIAHAEEKELVTLYFGADLSQNEAGHIAEAIRHAYPNLEDVELQEGGQPHYHLILSIE